MKGYKAASAGLLDEFPGTNTPDEIEQTLHSKRQDIQEFNDKIQLFRALLSEEKGFFNWDWRS